MESTPQSCCGGSYKTLIILASGFNVLVDGCIDSTDISTVIVWKPCLLSQDCLQGSDLSTVFLGKYYVYVHFQLHNGAGAIACEQARMRSHSELFRKAAGALLHPRTSQRLLVNGEECSGRSITGVHC